jgi:cell division protein FtsQ
MWLCIGGGMFTLLLAAISKKNKGQCRDYQITIKGAYNNFFIDKKDVEQQVMMSTKSKISGLAVSAFNLHALEQILEKNTWISDAELYFDNQDVLHITVIEKEPVARIFTTEGNSFYIDSLGRKMPLSDKLSARVPVFTGFPDKKLMSGKDSLLLDDIKTTANFIINDPFWMSQVAQIDITRERKFEMVPVIGNHLVRLGDGKDMAQKLYRLMIFYKQVLSKTGFDRYRLIDVQYKGQVVVSNDAGVARVDSVQLRKNIEKLIRQSRDAQNDTMPSTTTVTGTYTMDVDSSSASEQELSNNNRIKPGIKLNPNPVKLSLLKTGEKGKGKQSAVNENKPKPAGKKKEPKAIMPKKTGEETNGGYN